MRTQLRLPGLLLGLLLGVFVLSAEAAPISGSFSISGNFLPVLGSTGQATALNLATGIDFIDLVGSTPTPGTAGEFLVNSGSGTFASFVGNTGAIKDFTFAGTGSALFPSTPLTVFQTVGGLTFDLWNVSTIMQTADFLVLSGSGLFALGGYDATAGTFRFSGNGAGSTFSFSASQSATNQVPEPATLLFMGAGLLMGGYRLRRRSSATA